MKNNTASRKYASCLYSYMVYKKKKKARIIPRFHILYRHTHETNSAVRYKMDIRTRTLNITDNVMAKKEKDKMRKLMNLNNL